MNLHSDDGASLANWCGYRFATIPNFACHRRTRARYARQPATSIAREAIKNPIYAVSESPTAFSGHFMQFPAPNPAYLTPLHPENAPLIPQDKYTMVVQVARLGVFPNGATTEVSHTPLDAALRRRRPQCHHRALTRYIPIPPTRYNAYRYIPKTRSRPYGCPTPTPPRNPDGTPVTLHRVVASSPQRAVRTRHR